MYVEIISLASWPGSSNHQLRQKVWAHPAAQVISHLITPKIMPRFSSNIYILIQSFTTWTLLPSLTLPTSSITLAHLYVIMPSQASSQPAPYVPTASKKSLQHHVFLYCSRNTPQSTPSP